MPFRFRGSVAAGVAVVLFAGLGIWLLAGSPGGATRRHVVVGGVPLDEVHPPAGARRPGVVVAHGFAGSARLMAQFGDSLSAQGFVVVLLDFSGHGANTHPLPDPNTAALEHDLTVATNHLRSLPDVDPARISLVGHSMGASAVTRFAVTHPGITATVAISLPDARPDPPARLLLLVGALEFPGFRDAATQTQGSTVVVPGVEHISILYSPRTHREIGAWLGASTTEAPSPIRKISGAALLLLGLLIGLYPLARLLLGAPRGDRPRLPSAGFGRTVVVCAAVTAVAAAIAPLLPSNRLPLAVGGYVIGFTLLTGAAILVFGRRRGTPDGPVPVGRLRLAVATPVLIGYAATAIAVPLHLGLTHAIPVGARWWLLLLVWTGFGVLAYAAERVTGGNSIGVLTISAFAMIALTGAAVAGLTSGFVLLVVPLLAVLLLWQAIWSAVLHRFAAPAWLIAVVGSLIVAWPIATTLPVVS